MNVLSIRGLDKRFGATQALAGINLDVGKGSRTAIIGPSGSGKTTLLRLVAGFDAPDAGEIHLDGQLIADAAGGVPAHRRNVGLVMQEGALFPHLSVLDNIRFGIRDRSDGEARALTLMDLVELSRTMADRQPHQLSGGQQQRVALARALARQPRLMLLDEPFSALDTGLRGQLREATAQILANAGVATLLVTHDQEEAMSFADQLVVLREGRLIQAGPPQELYGAPADPITAEFLGPAIILEAEIQSGVARCPLGDVPVIEARAMPSGTGRILIRPEQIRIASPVAEDTAAAWQVVAVEHAGPYAQVTVKQLSSNAPSSNLVFKTPSVDLSPVGSTVALTVSGPAYRFPASA